MTAFRNHQFGKLFFATLCASLIQSIFWLGLSSSALSADIGHFRGRWTKTTQPTRPDQPGIGAWIKFDADDPSRLYLSWAPPMVVSDAEGRNGANFVWRNDATSCWYDMSRMGTKLVVRLTKSEPPGACLEDSVFEGESVVDLVVPPKSDLSEQTYTVASFASGGVLNMRTGPGVHHRLVVSIPVGATGIKKGECRSPDDGKSKHQWCRIRWRGYVGWASNCCLLPER